MPSAYSRYQVNVTVSNACNTSQVTAAPEVATPFAAASTVNGLYNSSITNNSFTAKCDQASVAGAEYILLEVACDAGFTNLVYGYPYTLGLVDSFQVTGLSYNTNYHWPVAAGSYYCSFNSTSCSAALNVLTVNHGTITYNTPNSSYGILPMYLQYHTVPPP